MADPCLTNDRDFRARVLDDLAFIKTRLFGNGTEGIVQDFEGRIATLEERTNHGARTGGVAGLLAGVLSGILTILIKDKTG